MLSSATQTNTHTHTHTQPFPDELNTFSARFDRDNQEAEGAPHTLLHRRVCVCVCVCVCAALSRINARKAAGPDGIPGRVLRACAGQLTEVLTDLFNLSLAQAAVPTCFKATPIVSVPKHTILQRALMTSAQLHSPPP